MSLCTRPQPRSLRAASLLLAAALAAGTAVAKLPPPTEEAKAKAAEATAKTAWSNKVAEYQLCTSMDRVAAQYATQAKAAGKAPKAPTATPPCADPGPFAYTAPEAKPAATKPLEAAGAHSPAATAATPPSSIAPSAAPPAPAKKP